MSSGQRRERAQAALATSCASGRDSQGSAVRLGTEADRQASETEEIASSGSTVSKVRLHQRVDTPKSDQHNESQAAGDQPGGRCAHDLCDHDVNVSYKA